MSCRRISVAARIFSRSSMSLRTDRLFWESIWISGLRNSRIRPPKSTVELKTLASTPSQSTCAPSPRGSGQSRGQRQRQESKQSLFFHKYACLIWSLKAATCFSRACSAAAISLSSWVMLAAMTRAAFSLAWATARLRVCSPFASHSSLIRLACLRACAQLVFHGPRPGLDLGHHAFLAAGIGGDLRLPLADDGMDGREENPVENEIKQPDQKKYPEKGRIEV